MNTEELKTGKYMILDDNDVKERKDVLSNTFIVINDDICQIDMPRLDESLIRRDLRIEYSDALGNLLLVSNERQSESVIKSKIVTLVNGSIIKVL